MNSMHYSREMVIGQLAQHHQRATYGAVGGVVGLPAQSVMYRQPKSHQNSFVVSSRYHLPTSYLPQELHPNLQSRSMVIASADDLRAWLREHE
jgi:hypothetical protein